jgi:8-oxo-dGTP pyrophosphatase MutT (NUDIX family)
LGSKDGTPDHQVAVAGLFDDANRVLLVRTRRLRDYWQPAGGRVQPHDPSPLDALTRELREELRLDLDPRAFKLEFVTQHDLGPGDVHFYSARLTDPDGIEPDFREIIEVRWFPLSAALLGLPALTATHKFLARLISRGGPASNAAQVPARRRPDGAGRARGAARLESRSD